MTAGNRPLGTTFDWEKHPGRAFIPATGQRDRSATNLSCSAAPSRQNIDGEWGNGNVTPRRRRHDIAERTPINPRLVNLLGSFIGGTSAYTLARLEFCLELGNAPAPPVLDRLPDASERTLRERWDHIENQLQEIVDYVKRIDANPRSSRRTAASFRSLKRTVRELDQYSRALRWVMTVTEQDPAE
jgi:hypothetical protein